MPELSVDKIEGLARQFFFEGLSLNPLAAQFERSELCGYLREYTAEIEGLLTGMTAEQAEYRPPGAPTGPDSSGDEEHFNASEIVTHMASALAFYQWNMTRALRQERPEFPRPPEGTARTGSKASPMGAGGWSGVAPPELARLLHDFTERFLNYVEGLSADLDETVTSRYAPFGDVSVKGWLCLAVAHAAMHLKQLREMVGGDGR